MSKASEIAADPRLGMSEAALQDAVTELAKALGYKVYHTRDSRGSAAGFPDLVMVRRDGVLWVELKSHTGVTSSDQREWLDLLWMAEQAVYTWRPMDWLNGTIERTLK